MRINFKQLEVLDEMGCFYLYIETGKLLVLDRFEDAGRPLDSIAVFVEYKDRNLHPYQEDTRGNIITYSALISEDSGDSHLECGEFDRSIPTQSNAVLKIGNMLLDGKSDFGYVFEEFDLGQATLLPIFVKDFYEVKNAIKDINHGI
jgi:hypothetical protein